MPATGGERLRGGVFVAALVAASAVLSARFSPAPQNPGTLLYYRSLRKAPFNPPDRAFAVWGPLYGLLGWSAYRIYLAPRSAARSRALGLWSATRVLDTLWLYLGFRRHRLGSMAGESAVALAAAAAYAGTAAKVDRPAALMVMPYVAWIGFAALLSEELWRRNR